MRRALQDALYQGRGKVRIEATLNAAPFYEKWGGARCWSRCVSRSRSDFATD